ncbi:hypothetical protein PGB34_10775 [Xenophilus arseniciresistens]|uniref:Meckel syndrome type 1 protein n=1 Tax=Xenophilus arseniciresistens TaxID=1283306 RepID=A0AAE3NC38_9BURK|nr:hypothetical protein [Xenophilus arseniciresistens]MDA7416849.1 hypothetical protein [Xenophilus arseniciresistens]
MSQAPNAHDDLAPDARWQRMLDHAPDAQVQPSAATRAAILEAAHRAVQAPAAKPVAGGTSFFLLRWLDRLLPRASAPWSAALATVVMAFFITLIWQGEPVPQAQPDGDRAALSREAPQAEMAPPAAPAAPAPMPQAAPAPATSAPGPAAVEPAPAQPAAPNAEASREQHKRAPPPAEPAAPQARLRAPIESQRDALEAGATAADARQAEARAPAPAAAAPPPAPIAAPEFPSWQQWTELQFTDAQGRSGTVPRERAAELTALLEQVLPLPRAEARDAALPASVDGRLTLRQGARVLGTLELGGNAVRWHAAGAAPAFALPPPAALSALRTWLAQAHERAR